TAAPSSDSIFFTYTTLFRSSLEQLAGERACALASDEGIAEIRRLHDEMIAAYQSGDRLNYYKLNQNIHLSIVALADNSALSDVRSEEHTSELQSRENLVCRL